MSAKYFMKLTLSRLNLLRHAGVSYERTKNIRFPDYHFTRNANKLIKIKFFQ